MTSKSAAIPAFSAEQITITKTGERTHSPVTTPFEILAPDVASQELSG
jgi:hypothetical protein